MTTMTRPRQVPSSTSFCRATVAALRSEHASLNTHGGTASSMRPLRSMQYTEILCHYGELKKLTLAPIIGCDPEEELAYVDAGSVDGGKPLAVPRTVVIARKDWKRIVANII